RFSNGTPAALHNRPLRKIVTSCGPLLSSRAMTNRTVRFLVLWISLAWRLVAAPPEPLPLPEHPRPDFERAAWTNLNGAWAFRFDPKDTGLNEKWFEAADKFPDRIIVPFPWGSPLSQVEDKAPIAWYSRTLTVPES